MSVPTHLRKLVGSWKGTSKLWRPWVTPVESESPSSATVANLARGKFLQLAYTWVVDGEPQEGALLVGLEDGKGTVHLVFVDSWHMSELPLYCEGRRTELGIDVRGTYAAPPDPDWSWRTVIELRGESEFSIVMYNITPAGEEAIAFENRYRRA